MTSGAATALDVLSRRFLLDFPGEAAQALEPLPAADAAELLARQPLHAVLAVWPYLSGDAAEQIFQAMSERLARGLLSELEPAHAAALLGRLTAVSLKYSGKDVSGPMRQKPRVWRQKGQNEQAVPVTLRIFNV